MSPLKIVTLVLALVATSAARPNLGEVAHGHSAEAHSAEASEEHSHGAEPAAPQQTYGLPPPTKYGLPEPESEEKAVYSFNWAVKDDEGNDFGHEESRDGDDTKGSYYVLLPDGRVEKVTYTVNGESGYEATVEFEGEAKTEEHKPAETYGLPPKPIYGAPVSAENGHGHK